MGIAMVMVDSEEESQLDTERLGPTANLQEDHVLPTPNGPLDEGMPLV